MIDKEMNIKSKILKKNSIEDKHIEFILNCHLIKLINTVAAVISSN